MRLQVECYDAFSTSIAYANNGTHLLNMTCQI